MNNDKFPLHTDLDRWYYSDEAEEAQDNFSARLGELVNKKYVVSYYEEEPSVQDLLGSDYIDIELSNGNKYSFEFNWYDMQKLIFEKGYEVAARKYFSLIREGIESGSASTDTPTL